MSTSESKTSILLSRWSAGDESALAALLERHLDWLRAEVKRRLSPALAAKVEADDFVQDAMVNFLRFAPRFVVSDDRQFRGLLLRIVENLLHDRYDQFTARRRQIAKERPLPTDSVLHLDPPDASSGGTPSRMAMRHERESWIRMGLEILEPAARELIVLRDWDGLTFAQIGERLGVPENTARMRYVRAVDRLARLVAQLRRGGVEAALDARARDEGTGPS